MTTQLDEETLKAQKEEEAVRAEQARLEENKKAEERLKKAEEDRIKAEAERDALRTVLEANKTQPATEWSTEKWTEFQEKYNLTKAEIDTLGKSVDLDRVLSFLKESKITPPNARWEDVQFYKAKPTPECEDGYSGRLGIHEVLNMTPTIRELIIKGATSNEIEVEAKKEGMFTMLEDGIYQAAAGNTTIEEVLRVVKSE